MATHSSIPAWEIPWTEEPGRLQSMGSQSDTTDGLTHIYTCNREDRLVLQNRDTGGDSESQSRAICGASPVWMQAVLGSREGGLSLLLTSRNHDSAHQ